MMMGFGLPGLLLAGGVLVVVLLGALGLSSSRGVDGRWLGEKRQLTARQVLDERLARGEVGVEEHETIRRQIEG